MAELFRVMFSSWDAFEMSYAFTLPGECFVALPFVALACSDDTDVVQLFS